MRVFFGRTVSSSNYMSEEALHINNCGFYDNPEFNIRVSRPEGRHDYQLLCITKGALTFRYNGEVHILHPGDIFIYPPGEPQYYESYDNKPIKFYWVHFSGHKVKELLASCNLSAGTIYSNVPKIPVESGVGKMVSEMQSRFGCFEINCIGIFISLLARLSVRTELKDRETVRKINKIREELDENFTQCRSVEEYARRCGISTSHFIRLFYEQFGKTPKAYITDLRLTAARKLLLHSNLSIGEIGTLCGYDDPLYFSRAFSKAVGRSPKAFRGY